jgi:2-furoyl-CoA dehydrogenase FAD binding subunit
MSLGPMLNMRLVRPAVVVDIGRVESLRVVEKAGNQIRIGAAVRQADVMRDANVAEAVPLLAAALPHVGHYQTRSRGTFGGSVGHADPSAEIPLALVTLGGMVELASAGEFFKGILMTDRSPDELIVATTWPERNAATGYAFAEFAQRHGDFAIAAAACVAELDGSCVRSLRLGFGGVEDRPILIGTSKFLGAEANAELATAVAEHAAGCVDPLEDMTAGADYRRALAGNLARQVIDDAFAEAGV